MHSSRSIYRLATSERLALRRQWLRSGQCLRCLHESMVRKAEDDTSQETSHNAPRRGPTRQERATMISEEVKMIQRDHPAPTFSEADPNTLRPPGASQTVDPEVLGKDVAPGRMGENDTPTQEGANDQGVGRVIDAFEDVVSDTSRIPRGARSPDSPIEGQVEGEMGALISTHVHRGRKVHPSTPQKRQPITAVAQFRKDIASGNYSTSTIAGGRFESLIVDQVHTAMRRASQSPPRGHQLGPRVVDKVVAGSYDPAGHLSGKKVKSSTLKEIAKTTSLNGTYLPGDRNKFLQKVKELLPATPAQRPRQQQN